MAEVTDRWAAGAAYEVFMGRWSRRLARQFVDWLDVEPRAHWLDVGCGTGALTAAICELRNPASVIACDPSGPLLEMASATLADKRVCFEIAQAERPLIWAGGGAMRAGAGDAVIVDNLVRLRPGTAVQAKKAG